MNFREKSTLASRWVLPGTMLMYNTSIYDVKLETNQSFSNFLSFMKFALMPALFQKVSFGGIGSSLPVMTCSFKSKTVSDFNLSSTLKAK